MNDDENDEDDSRRASATDNSSRPRSLSRLTIEVSLRSQPSSPMTRRKKRTA